MNNADGPGEPKHAEFDRLYTPWRMNYVRGERKHPGCVFCSIRDSGNDDENLMLTRGEHSYVVLNLFPYNTGHLLIVPNLHVASPEELPRDAQHELADQLSNALVTARLALAPDAFNAGFNLGTEAGAGIAAHLHQHLVPRWRGDANFMPIIGGTKVLPELLAVTAAKMRAEFLRAQGGSVQMMVLDHVGNRLLVDSRGSSVHQVPPEDAVPLWKSAIALAARAGVDARLTGMENNRLILEALSVGPELASDNWIAGERSDI